MRLNHEFRYNIVKVAVDARGHKARFQIHEFMNDRCLIMLSLGLLITICNTVSF